ncbi:MAG: carbohydrate kinase [Anaerolineales bacterium]|nr:carbohydrate kinase [Anaerolineales bacterium]
MRLIGVGDNTADHYLHLGKMFPGGNAVNVAALASRYGHQSSYLGWLGKDRAGRLILDALQSEGVDTSHCRVVDGITAFCEVNLVNGDRVFGRWDPGVRLEICLTEQDLDFITVHDLVHTSIYSGLEKQLPQLAVSAKRLSFDFSSDWTNSTLTKVLPYVTIAAVSFPDQPEEEVKNLLEWVYKQGPEIVLLTQGDHGAFAYNGDRVLFQPIIETEVVDTLGAGDAFLTRFLVGYYSGDDLGTALNKAAEAASQTCRTHGAFGHGISIE